MITKKYLKERIDNLERTISYLVDVTDDHKESLYFLGKTVKRLTAPKPTKIKVKATPGRPKKVEVKVKRGPGRPRKNAQPRSKDGKFTKKK